MSAKNARPSGANEPKTEGPHSVSARHSGCAHTPGPWRVEINGGSPNAIWATVNIGRTADGGVLQPIYEVPITPQLAVGKDGYAYAMLAYDSWRQFPSVQFDEMQRANARLIAAAPDLLQALKAHDQYMLDAGYEGPESDALHKNAAANWRRVRAAIGKAEGK